RTFSIRIECADGIGIRLTFAYLSVDKAVGIGFSHFGDHFKLAPILGYSGSTSNAKTEFVVRHISPCNSERPSALRRNSRKSNGSRFGPALCYRRNSATQRGCSNKLAHGTLTCRVVTA